jgi:3-oxoacyl-[acyl-carrier protein] reductase
MDLGLRGTVAVVAAASQGLGKAVALQLAREGANLAICSRKHDAIEEAASDIRQQTGAEVLAVVADVSTPDGPDALVRAAVERFGRLDILVCNAGGPPPGGFSRHHDDEAWREAFDLNLLSAVRLVRAAVPYLRQSGHERSGGRIINMVSSSVKQPIEGLVLSNAVRSGVIGLAKTLAAELAPDGITVNNIAPGRFDTARIRQIDQARAESLGITEEQARSEAIKQIPAGRYGHPEEFAYLAAFLASDKAAYITGATIQIDGGMVKSLL